MIPVQPPVTADARGNRARRGRAHCCEPVPGAGHCRRFPAWWRCPARGGVAGASARRGTGSPARGRPWRACPTDMRVRVQALEDRAVGVDRVGGRQPRRARGPVGVRDGARGRLGRGFAAAATRAGAAQRRARRRQRARVRWTWRLAVLPARRGVRDRARLSSSPTCWRGASPLPASTSPPPLPDPRPAILAFRARPRGARHQAGDRPDAGEAHGAPGRAVRAVRGGDLARPERIVARLLEALRAGGVRVFDPAPLLASWRVDTRQPAVSRHRHALAARGHAARRRARWPSTSSESWRCRRCLRRSYRTAPRQARARGDTLVALDLPSWQALYPPELCP